MPGRSKELDGHKSVSSVKNYVRALVKAELVWLDELGIHVTALEPKPAPITTQQPLPDLDEPRTLEMIANDIKAATDRGDFATVAQLAAEANALPATSEEAGAELAKAGPIEATAAPDLESKNCRALSGRLILLVFHNRICLIPGKRLAPPAGRTAAAQISTSGIKRSVFLIPKRHGC